MIVCQFRMALHETQKVSWRHSDINVAMLQTSTGSQSMLRFLVTLHSVVNYRPPAQLIDQEGGDAASWA